MVLDLATIAAIAGIIGVAYTLYQAWSIQKEKRVRLLLEEQNRRKGFSEHGVFLTFEELRESPTDYVIQKYVEIMKQPIRDWHDEYLWTYRNDRVKQYLNDKCRVLLIGPSGLGKTRMVLEVLKERAQDQIQDESLVIALKPSPNLNSLPVLKQKNDNKWKQVVLFFDDINEFVLQESQIQYVADKEKITTQSITTFSTIDLSRIVKRFEEVSEQVYIIATCRSEEYPKIRYNQTLRHLFHLNEILRLELYSVEEGRQVAGRLGKEMPRGFSGTMDLIVLDTLRKREYYDLELNDHEKAILKAVKLLRVIGIPEPKLVSVKLVWDIVFRRSELLTASWDTCLNKVSRDYGFFSVLEPSQSVSIPDVFIDDSRDVIVGYKQNSVGFQDDLQKLEYLFRNERSYREIITLGQYYLNMNKYGDAINCLEYVIECEENIDKNMLADAYFYRGNSFSSLGDYDHALEDFNKSIKLEPEHASAYNNRGLVYRDLGEQEKAIEDCTKAIELDAEYVVAYNNRGLMYSDLGEHDKAIKDCTKAIELDPENAPLYTNRGTVYSDLGDHEKALEDYYRAIELNPADARPYYNRGIEYNNLGEQEKVIEDCTKAIELDPEYTRAYFQRGNMYSNLGEHEKALEDYSRAIELDPEDASVYNNRGIVYRNLAEHEKAIEDYSRAIELDPDDAPAYFNRGIVYKDLREHEKAIEDYSRAIELNPEYASSYFNRGNAYSNLGEHEKAIEDYSRAIELDPDDAPAYTNRGNAFYYLGKHEKAIKDHTKAIKLDPENASAYNNRGMVYRDLGEHEKALVDCTKAVKLDPENVSIYNNRGLVYSNLGEHEKALLDYTKSIELEENSKALTNRGSIYFILGEYHKAFIDLNRSIVLNPVDFYSYFYLVKCYSATKEWDKAFKDCEKAWSNRVSDSDLCKDLIELAIEALMKSTCNPDKIQKQIEVWKSRRRELDII